MHGDSQEALSLLLFHFFPPYHLNASLLHTLHLLLILSLLFWPFWTSPLFLLALLPSSVSVSLSSLSSCNAIQGDEFTSSSREPSSPDLLLLADAVQRTCKTDIHAKQTYMYMHTCTVCKVIVSKCKKMQHSYTYRCYFAIMKSFLPSLKLSHILNSERSCFTLGFFSHNFCLYSNLCRFSCMLSTLYFALNMHANQAYDMKLDQTKQSKRITFASFTSYSLKLFFYCMLFQL